MDEADDTAVSPVGTNRRSGGDKREIEGHQLRPSTLMMGHGYDPVLSEGALKPPVFLTSTFAFESAAAGKRPRCPSAARDPTSSSAPMASS